MITKFIAPAVLIGIIFVQAGAGLLPFSEACWIVAAIAIAYGPSAFRPGQGHGRRFAELLLLTVVATVMLAGDPVERMMLVPPLLLICAWAAWFAAIRGAGRTPTVSTLTSCFGVAVRIGVGSALMSEGWHGAVAALAVAAVLPWMAARWSPALGLVAVLLTATTPFQRLPWAAWLALAAVGGLLIVTKAFRNHLSTDVEHLENDFGCVAGLLPILGAAAVLAMAVAPWGGLSPSAMIPTASWVSWAAFAVVAVVTLRIPASSAAACTVLAVFMLGPISPQVSTVAGVRLTSGNIQHQLPRGNGGSYALDLVLNDGSGVHEGATAARIQVGERTVPIRVGKDIVEKSFLEDDNDVTERHARNLIRRPRSRADSSWSVCTRTIVKVADGFEPVIRRNPKIRKAAEIEVLRAGPIRRRGLLRGTGGWMFLAMGLVPVIQLISGVWLRQAAWLAWWPLVTGLLLNRIAVEPLHGLGCEFEWVLCVTALGAALAPWVVSRVRELREGP